MSLNIAIDLKNPDKKSLKELHFVFVDGVGVKRNIPALDKYWAPRSIFSTYNGLVMSGGKFKTAAALQEWQHESESFKEDITFLLSLSQHEFWSYMIYQQSALGAVVSFLQKATPFYMNIFAEDLLPVGVQELYEEILNLVLRVICRILSPKESRESWVKKDDLKELIYKHYLISVPMLFDLLVAVGNGSRENSELLRKIFDTLFTIEPNYKNDLLHALSFFRTTFRSIHTQTENEGFEGAGGGLDESFETPFDDVVLYTLDCAFTLSVLLDVCPSVRGLSGEIKLAQTIANFYDNTLPFLYKNIFLTNDNAKSLLWLNYSRLHFLRAFRSIANSYVDAVLAKPETSLSSTEEFIGLMTECLAEQTFVIDYERHYSLALDMQILKQACPDMDSFKANFIVEGYRNESATAVDCFSADLQNDIVNCNPATKSLDESVDIVPEHTNELETNAALPSRDIELEVTIVLDCLPHLGTGFIRRLLSRYDTTEAAISAVLESNLPPDLAQGDQSEVYIPPDPQDTVFKETGVKHYNIYDGDKYDIMTQDNPQCIIKQGKGMPNAPKNAALLLDDKSHLASVRHRYQEYSLVTEDNENDDDQEYNDEYDDSYEALLESETRVVKSKDMKKVLANVADESEDEETDSEDEGSSQKENDQKSNNFCENPEEIRARYEARRQAKWSKRGINVPQPNHDVVGKTKGQGQDKETLRSRQKKEANKSSRANHNRKAGATFKRSKGML